MISRVLFATIIAALLSFSHPALAQGNSGGNGNSSGNNGGNSEGNGNGNGGGGNSQGNGNSGGGGNGNSGNAGSGNSGGNGNGGGNANGNGGSGGNGNAGGNGGSGGNGNAGGNSNSGTGNGDGTGNNNGNGGANGPASGGTSPLPLSPSALPAADPSSGSEEKALGAVQAGQAVPLTTILSDLEARGAGEMIDAQLVTAGSFLLYAVKVLSSEGRVATEYYYARTGRPVEVN